MQFNLPSVQHMITESTRSFRRFPFTILSGVIAAVSAIYLTELDYNVESDVAVKLLMVSLLGISLFTVIVLTGEKRSLGRRRLWIAQGAGVLLLLAYYFWLPADITDSPQKPIIRYILFFLGMHLLVAYLPFAGSNELNGFWQYNKSLFLRFLTAVLYSGVLFIGLSVALLSIDQLFGIEIREELYLELWIVLAFIFNTWFFLSGVPENLDALERLRDYPKGLKVFTQYVLMPLVSIYLVILYGYALKILIEWEWPEGWVANLVLGFSIVGIFALLLLHPIRNRVEYGWIKSVSRNYYIVLLPLVFLLLLAIWVRISEYSFTENRYFVLVAGLWLGAIALYFIFSGERNIKVVPASLAAIVFLSSFGPWGAFYVSESSQISRLEGYLEEYDILAEGRVRPISGELPFEDAKEISAIFRYLVEVHGLDGVRPWFEPDSESWNRITEEHANLQPQLIVEELGLEYIDRYETGASYTRSFSTSTPHPLPAGEYDWLIADLNLDTSRLTEKIAIDSEQILVRLHADSAVFSISRGMAPGPPLATVALDTLVQRLNEEFSSSNSYNITPDKMAVTAENDRVRVMLAMRYIQARRSEGEWSIQNLRLTVLFALKE